MNGLFIIVLLAAYVAAIFVAWRLLWSLSARIEARWQKVFLKALAVSLAFSPSLFGGAAHGGAFILPMPALLGLVVGPESPLHIFSLGLVFSSAAFYFALKKQ